MRARLALVIAAAVCASTEFASAQIWYLSGKVVMEDGSPPPKPVSIERYCGVNRIIREAITDRQGRFLFRHMESDSLAGSKVNTYLLSMSMMSGTGGCILRASLPGYESTVIDLDARRPTDDPHLPPMILRRPSPGSTFSLDAGYRVPSAARKLWERALKAAEARRLPEAERQLRAAVQVYPRFSRAWHLLGAVCQNQKKGEEAREAYRRAIETEPKFLAPYILLTRLELDMKDWQAALQSSNALIQADSRRRFPEAYVHNATARYNLGDLDGAEASAREALRLDKKGLIPRAQYTLGMILAAKRDYAGAAEHMQRYLTMEPKAGDAQAVRERIARLGTPEDEPRPLIETTVSTLPAAGEAWAPGGMRALARAAHIEKPVSFENFWSEYSDAVFRHAVPDYSQGVTKFREALYGYFTAVAELTQAGERKGERTLIKLSLAAPERRKETEKLLALLGWKVVSAAGSFEVEPGDRMADGLRQPILTALDVDPVAMQETLEAGGVFEFEIPSETARLVGGDAWSSLISPNQVLPGGLAEAFVRDLRLAKVYAALSTLGPETASALVEGVGLRALIERHAEFLVRCSPVLRIEAGAVATPGGAPAEAAWTRLAGVSPRNPPAFFRALFQKDQGRLAAFYLAVAQSDEAHRRFFTATPERAVRLYARNWSNPAGAAGALPLDGAGNVRFPGGRRAWAPSAGSDEAALLELSSLDALLAVAGLERGRPTPLDAGAVQLLAGNYGEWRSLFPYFERLPGLGRAEFAALEAFTARTRTLEPAVRNAALGEWHSLVELIVLGSAAGSLDAAAATRMFRRTCEALSAGDFSAQAVEVLRAMAGQAPNPAEALASKLLRLDPQRTAQFLRVLELQNVPRLDAARLAGNAGLALHALSGVVYAALLPPDCLLVSEDPLLVRKHRFFEMGPKDQAIPAFQPAVLHLSNKPPGSYFSGGFAGFAEAARDLARAAEPATAAATGDSPAPGAPPLPALPSPGDAPLPATGHVFRADARLVEVHATITDERGRYVDGLRREQFTILDQGEPRPIAAFETHTSALSCALLLDTTGSMEPALPALKNAALKLIDELRDEDAVAVYTFQDSVSLPQPLTTDKRAAKRAVLRAVSGGQTALYDALVRVTRDIAGRSGKKVIIVFTDGADNVSALTAEAAVRRAKIAGVPVYAIAQGAALDSPVLLKQLESIASATGGLAYGIRGAGQIRAVFESVAEDLKHGYLLAYQPAPVQDREWRRIELRLSGAQGFKVRAREGYYPE